MTSDLARDHLFISYATEQAYLARWLTAKLSSEGYRVWCDEFELLGGESFPRDIDVAIRDRTFRLLALISKESLAKDNPTKERALAINISKERKVDFLIPLLVDSTKPVDLSWTIADLTYIPFHESVSAGYIRLLRVLERANAPRTLANGRSVAASAFMPDSSVVETEETIYTNLLPVQQIPLGIKVFTARAGGLTPEKVQELQERWPARQLNERQLAAFSDPPDDLAARFSCSHETSISWKDVEMIGGMRSHTLVKSIVRTSLYCHALSLGLSRDRNTRRVYFARGLLPGNKLSYVDHHGRSNWFLAAGLRERRGEKYAYHLSPHFRIRTDIWDTWCVQLSVLLLITDENGNQLGKHAALSRRKSICSSWWNEEWLKRVLGLAQFLSRSNSVISIGYGHGGKVEIETTPLSLNCDVGIDEELLKDPTENDLAILRSSPGDEDSNDEGDAEAGGEETS